MAENSRQTLVPALPRGNAYGCLQVSMNSHAGAWELGKSGLKKLRAML